MTRKYAISLDKEHYSLNHSERSFDVCYGVPPTKFFRTHSPPRNPLFSDIFQSRNASGICSAFLFPSNPLHFHPFSHDSRPWSKIMIQTPFFYPILIAILLTTLMPILLI